MENIISIANREIQKHTEALTKQRRAKILFKEVGPKGKLIGRPFQFMGPKFKRLRKNKTEIKKLANTEKKGDERKYKDALASFLSPCHSNCGKKYCVYDFFRRTIPNKIIPRHSALAIRFAITMCESPWKVFASENNLGPTKQVIKLLQKNFKFIQALEQLTTKKTPWILPIPLLFPIAYTPNQLPTLDWQGHQPSLAFQTPPPLFLLSDRDHNEKEDISQRRCRALIHQSPVPLSNPARPYNDFNHNFIFLSVVVVSAFRFVFQRTLN